MRQSGRHRQLAELLDRTGELRLIVAGDTSDPLPDEFQARFRDAVATYVRQH
jgi:hypothetical protein